MLEAVNSVVSNAPLLKVSTDNTRIDKGIATAPDAVQKVTVAAPYISPYVYVTKGQAVLQIRDNNTGDVQRQIPKGATSSAPAPAVTSTEAEIVSSASAAALTSSTPQAQAPVQVEAPVSTQTAAVEYAATSAAVTNTAPSTGSEVSVLT